MNRELPKNIEAEKCLLGSMFWSKAALQKGCEEAFREMFYLESHSKIFDAIQSLYLNETPVDITSVTTYLINVEKISGKKFETINIVGGGCQNKMLNELTAEWTGKKVVTGPIEATAVGNLVAQMIANGEIKDLYSAREIIKKSFDIETIG